MTDNEKEASNIGVGLAGILITVLIICAFIANAALSKGQNVGDLRHQLVNEK